MRGFIQQHPHVVVDFPVPDGQDPFDNLNTPEDLARAEARLAGASPSLPQRSAPDTATLPPPVRTGHDLDHPAMPGGERRAGPDRGEGNPPELTRIEEPLPRRESAGTRRVAVVHMADAQAGSNQVDPGQEHAAVPPSDEGAGNTARMAARSEDQGRVTHSEGTASTRRPQRVLGVTGWKNAGKTGLVERLVALFTRRGLTVSTIKHAHHGFDIDRPGADSYRHREAGAREVAIVANDRIAIMQELRGAPEPDLVTLLARMTPVDLVIVEGYKREAIPKIEARRRDARSREPLADNDPTIFAIAADHPVEDAEVPVLPLDDTEAIADLVTVKLGLGES